MPSCMCRSLTSLWCRRIQRLFAARREARPCILCILQRRITVDSAPSAAFCRPYLLFRLTEDLQCCDVPLSSAVETRSRQETASPEREGKFSAPPSPSSVEGATGEKNPVAASNSPAEALAEAPVSTVQVISSREGTLSAERGGVEAVVGAKAERTAAQPSPSTPRTEEASPAGGSGLPVTPIRTSARKGAVGPFAFPPEAPMFVLPLAGLSAAGCFPKYDAAMRSGALVRYDSLDRNSTFVVFVSHRWVNESGPTCGGGFRQQGAEGVGGGGDGASDVDSAKHAFVVEGLNSILASLPREVAVFVWLDYSCIDQVERVSKRSLSFASCIIVCWPCRNVWFG